MSSLQKKILGMTLLMVSLAAIGFFVVSAEKAPQAEAVSQSETGQETEDQPADEPGFRAPAVTSQAVAETASVETPSAETQTVEKENAKIVTTTSGRIEGKKTSKAYIWLGVPYGQTERWQAPEAPDPWTKIRSCKKKKKGKGDDCLFVNVYKPLKVEGDQDKLPVIVFLHGGGNAAGTPNWNFSSFVRETGVIAVSVEFRRGAFGWFTSRGMETDDNLAKGGNFAMLDIKLALEWVQQNIDAFGGDNANVTLSGFSAGARDVLNCTISPVMKGLFHKVVSFSGGMTTCSIKQGRKWSNEKLAQILVRRGRFSDKKKALKYVKRISRKKLNRLLNSLTDSEIKRMVSNTGLRLTNFPQCFRDGRVIPKAGFDCVEWGAYTRVPMMISSNNSEFANVSYQALQRIREGNRKLFKNKKQFYTVLKRARDYGSQLQSSFYLEKVASKYSADPYHSSIYTYRFCWGESKNVVNADYAQYIGAIHGMDVDFLLGRYIKGDDVMSAGIYKKDNAKGRKALTHVMRQYMRNFLYTGNPNGTDAEGKTLTKWNRWGKPGSKRIMTFSATKTKEKVAMTARYIDRTKCKKKMRRSLSKKTYKLLKKRILNDRFFM